MNAKGLQYLDPLQKKQIIIATIVVETYLPEVTIGVVSSMAPMYRNIPYSSSANP